VRFGLPARQLEEDPVDELALAGHLRVGRVATASGVCPDSAALLRLAGAAHIENRDEWQISVRSQDSGNPRAQIGGVDANPREVAASRLTPR